MSISPSLLQPLAPTICLLHPMHSDLFLAISRGGQTSKTWIRSCQLISPCLIFVLEHLGRHSTYCVWGRLLWKMRKTKGRSSCDISSLWDSGGWLQHFTRLLSCQSGSQRWGRGTPGNQSKLNYYLCADKDKTISFLNSSQNEMGGGGCEEIKSVNIFNESNYWIISHTVHLLHSIPVKSEILKYCIAFLYSCNHINAL